MESHKSHVPNQPEIPLFGGRQKDLLRRSPRPPAMKGRQQVMPIRHLLVAIPQVAPGS